MIMLTERQQKILASVVESFVRNAEPVGSRTISKRGDIQYSAATVRNEMADLEEMGFLEQPHASAGRIPTNQGYRYYVDHLVQPRSLDLADINMIRQYFTKRINELEQAFQQIAVIISQLTNYTSIVLGPEVHQCTLKHLQIVPLSDHKAVAIMVTDTGHVEKRSISVTNPTVLKDLEKLVNLLNDKLSGVALNDVRAKMYSEIFRELSKHTEQYEDLMRIVDQILKANERDRIFMGGATNLMNQPEFHDVRKVKLIFDLFEDQDVLRRLFDSEKAGIRVTIGNENELEAVSNCSIITSTFTIQGRYVGSIGILGPTRMDYGKLIGLIDYLSQDFPRLIDRLYDASL